MFRKLSTGVYLIHMLVALALEQVYGRFTGLLPFLLIALISNLLVFLYLVIKNRRAKPSR